MMYILQTLKLVMDFKVMKNSYKYKLTFFFKFEKLSFKIFRSQMSKVQKTFQFSHGSLTNSWASNFRTGLELECQLLT